MNFSTALACNILTNSLQTFYHVNHFHETICKKLHSHIFFISLCQIFFLKEYICSRPCKRSYGEISRAPTLYDCYSFIHPNLHSNRIRRYFFNIFVTSVRFTAGDYILRFNQIAVTVRTFRLKRRTTRHPLQRYCCACCILYRKQNYKYPKILLVHFFFNMLNSVMGHFYKIA